MNASPVVATSQPWWKYPHMWLVVGGPLIVVIASLVTVWLAIGTPDPVYSDSATGRSAAEAARLSPALQARNHAATGGVAQQTPASASSAVARP
ncbi:MAG: nitrogen fixation protein FixH [Burkholderiaceae bacterium]|nr:nitrogen fixation protein FixH [Burkholderiaceae bacterium]